jgi:hypothetical protein
LVQELYMTRSKVLRDNVDRWILSAEEPKIHLQIGVGLLAKLSVTVSKFLPKNKAYLEHVTFRVDAKGAQVYKPTEPYGFPEKGPSYVELDKFVDALISELLAEEDLRKRNPIGFKTLEETYRRSQDTSRNDVCIYPSLGASLY